MRILLLHNYYQNSGGEDTVVANEKSLLLENGHKVELYSDSNQRIISGWDKVKTAVNLTYSKNSHRQLTDVVRDFRPDIIHAHNLFPLITAAAYDVAIANKTPVVQTIHNYRTSCASGIFFRDGQPCELCIANSPYNAVVNKCYRGSALASLAVSRMIDNHRRNRTYIDKVDQFIALTEFAKNKLIAANIPPEKICVKPNFTDRKYELNNSQPRDSVLFVGRLSPEKGIDTLINTWLLEGGTALPQLRIVGDGPLFHALKHKCRKRKEIVFLGQQPSEVVEREMNRAKFLVFPSVYYEGFPMVILEAFAAGLPVVCCKIGSMASIIDDEVTGLYFAPSSSQDLRKKIESLIGNDDLLRAMRDNCIEVLLTKYTPDINYQKLLLIYLKAIDQYSHVKHHG